MQKLLASLFALVCIAAAPLVAQLTTSVQIIHNSASPASSSVGVWLGLPGGTFLPAVPSLTFRGATPTLTGLGTAVPSLDAAVSVPLTVNITAPNASAATPAIASVPLQLGRGRNIVVANGLVNRRFFAPNPDNVSTDFALWQFVDQQVTVSTSTVRLLIVHGATDAPRVDIVARGVGILATASYGQGAFVNVPVGDYTIDITVAGTQTVVASYAAPLASLGLGGQRLSVLASGFLNPSANRSGDAFALLAVPTTPGVTPLLLPSVPVPMPPPPPTTLQIIHNAADPAASRVSVWVGVPSTPTQTTFIPAVPNLPFRGATSTLTGLGTTVPSLANAVGVPLTINVSATTNTAPTPAVAVFPNVRLSRGTNIVIANGVTTTTGFAANPNSVSTGFGLFPFLDTVTTISANTVRLLVFHGASDAPRVDIIARGVGIIATASYTQGAFVNVPVGNYTLDVQVAGTRTIVASFSAPLASLGLGGQRVSVLASGFLNPAQNRNGAAFGLLAVTANPAATPLLLPSAPLPPPLPPTTLQVIHNAADPVANSVGVWVGLPGSSVFLPAIPSFNFRTATSALTGLGTTVPFFSDAVGVPLTVNVTAPNAASATPALNSTPLSLSVGANIIIANGNVRPRLFAANPDNVSTAFSLTQFVDQQTVSSSTVRLLIFHGATDAPRVDVVARGVGTLATASYGQGAFVNVPVGDYIIDIRPAGSQTVVASFSAPLATLGLGGQRVSVLASGYLNATGNQSGAPFGLFAVVNSSSPNVIATLLPSAAAPLRTAAASTNAINSLSVSPNPTTESATLTYELAEAGTVNVGVYNTFGQAVSTVENTSKVAGTYSVNVPVSGLQSGMYECRVVSASGAKSTRLMVVR
jgi:Secretion system C-terminal sorting domain